MDKYEPKGFALEIFKQRYAFTKEETFDQACKRVARATAACEKAEKKNMQYERFYEELTTNRFMPGGRIWFGSGRPKSSLINCFVIPVEDSIESWGKLLNDTTIISSRGGGVGTNYSSVRPRGTNINGTGGKTTGAVSLMRIINGIADEIKSGGGRRSALMMALDIFHADIEEFLDVKLNRNELNNANVSVVFDKVSPKEFFDKVKNNEFISFLWRQEKIKQLGAKKLWRKIVTNSMNSGEPGILNLHLANEMNNVYYHKRIECTNPCGEIPMFVGSCILGSIVLPRFVKNGEIDWDQLDETIRISIRFLDNVLASTNYPIKIIEEESLKTRRIGLGVIGLHDLLLKLGYDYTMKKSLKKIDEIFNFIKNRSYEASTYLAAEKGVFPVFDKELFMQSGFVQKLKSSVKNRVKQHGIRNCAVNTCPPTGTTSIVCGSKSSGIEPSFGPAWIRRYRKEAQDGSEEFYKEIVFHPLFQEMMENGTRYKMQNSYEMSLENHFEIQTICQEHVDQGISKTIIVDKNSKSEEEYSNLLMEYLPKLKGITVYPLESRDNQPITPMNIQEATEAWQNKEIEKQKESGIISLDTCKNGSCEI